MIRGGHVGVAVLGALQVDARGRVANWAVPGRPILGVGGAMDLLVGAQRVIVATTHLTKAGEPKIVAECTLPLTAERPVDLIVTEHATFAVRDGGLVLTEVAPDSTANWVREHTGAAFREARDRRADRRRRCARRSAATAAGSRPSGPTTSRRTPSARCSTAPACRPRDRGRRARAAPTRRARTTATSRGWPRCSPAFPESVGGVTVNRLCGSGMDAVAYAARAIALGDGAAYVAGGVESMSRAPFVVPKPSRAYPTGPVEMVDTTLGWRLVNPRMEALGHTDPLGQTAENLAAEHRIARSEQDAFALRSHAKAVAALDAGRFDAELVPVDVPARRETVTVAADEVPRRDSTLEALGRLRPAFARDGTVTAGNSSTLNDGAGALLLTSPDFAARARPGSARARAQRGGRRRPAADHGHRPGPRRREGARPRGPDARRHGPDRGQRGVRRAGSRRPARSGSSTPTTTGSTSTAGRSRSGIRSARPAPASSPRTAHELRRRGGRFALVSMCIGVGQGIALVLEAA